MIENLCQLCKKAMVKCMDEKLGKHFVKDVNSSTNGEGVMEEGFEQNIKEQTDPSCKRRTGGTRPFSACVESLFRGEADINAKVGGSGSV